MSFQDALNIRQASPAELARQTQALKEEIRRLLNAIADMNDQLSQIKNDVAAVKTAVVPRGP